MASTSKDPFKSTVGGPLKLKGTAGSPAHKAYGHCGRGGRRPTC